MPDNEVSSARFDVPASPERKVYIINNFLGCDFTSSPSAVDESHSSDAVNFIRYMPGKIRKRMGYEAIVESDKYIYAIWKWDNDNYLVHAGNRIYHIGRDNNGKLDFSVVGEDDYHDTAYSQELKLKRPSLPNIIFTAPTKKLCFSRSGNEAIIFGGGSIYFYNAEHLDYIYDENSYDITVPIVTISKKPSGGGTSYQPVNLINSKFTESFYVSSSDVDEHGECNTFKMSFGDLTSVTKVEVMNSNGVWETRSNSQYSVNTTTGVITFNISPPGISPVEGEDNVRITASKAFSGYRDKIGNCTFSIAYGVNGNYDRLFVSGNSTYPNQDWFSDVNDITYFPDVNYSVMGSDASPIKGYAVVSNYLVTLKGDGSDKQTAIIRSGSLDASGNAIFKIVKSLQGYPIVSPDTSIVAGIEPMFLSQEGIMAITTADITGDYMMNSRSFFLNGKLMKEPHLEKAFAIRNGDYYMLFVNSHVYILDTLQIITTANAPYSTRQYATFYWDNIPATCAITIDEVVYFGTADGKIMRFYTDPDNLLSYSDDGEAIYCKYDTADIDALLFFKLKTYRYFSVRVFPAIATTLNIYAYKGGQWELLKSDSSTVRYFSFKQLVFSKLTFRTDKGTRLVASKIRLKKLDHVRFRVENGKLHEPLMIDQFGIEYTQSGNFKS